MNEPTACKLVRWLHALICESIWWIDRKSKPSIHLCVYKCICFNHFNFCLKCWMPKIPKQLSIFKTKKKSQVVPSPDTFIKKKTTNLCTFISIFQRKQRTFFDHFFFNYPLENILHQLTVKSKRCNVNHKRFSTHWNRLKGKCIIL